MPTFTAPYLSSTATALVALHTGPFTITGWFEPTALSTVYTPYLPTPILTGPSWSISLNEDGTLSFLVNNSALSISTTVKTSASVNSGWNFFAVVYSPNPGGTYPNVGTITIWLNGVPASAALLALADSTVSSVSPYKDFELGNPNLMSWPAPDGFSLDAVGVWARALSSADVGIVYNSGRGNPYPFLGGPFSLIFQANLVNDTPTPLVICSQDSVFSVAETSANGAGATSYEAFFNYLYQGTALTPGYNWTADNFSDKVILAQHDNPALYWTPPSATALPLPGLPAGSQYDGVAVFQNHVLLWQDDNLIWSDIDDFTDYIPIASTVVSAVLTLLAPFVQPIPGGSVTVQVANPAAVIPSLSISGDLTFPNTNVNDTSQALLTLTNTGNAPIEINSIDLPAGFAGTFTGPIAVGASQSVTITFSPTQSIPYSGTIVVGCTGPSGSTVLGTTVYPISGTGIGATAIINLSGNFNFGSVVVKTLPAQPQPGFLDGYVLVTNPGNTALNITSVTVPAGFSTTFTTGTVPGTTSPSEAPGTLVIPIRFTPTSFAIYTGDVTVNCSNATNGMNYVAVNGTGVSSLTTPSVFINDNGACQFGFVNTGTITSPVEVTITNVSGVGVYVYPILPSTSIPGFVIGAPLTGVPPASGLAPYASTTFSVTFEPTLVQGYAGSISITYTHPGAAQDYLSNALPIFGTGVTPGPQIVASGSLNYGDVPYGSTVAAMFSLYNPGQSNLTVSDITYPSAVFTGPASVTVAPGQTINSYVYFTPAFSDETINDTFSGDITATTNVPNGLGGFTPVSYPISGTGIPLPVPLQLVAGQVVSLTVTQGDFVYGTGTQVYYNYYTVTSMTGKSLVLTLMNLTGATPAGLTVAANGVQFFTLDANEAGSTVVSGSRMNGPIFDIIPQGDYAYIFKSRSIQSIAYTGLGNGTFFIHNEISGEGLIGRNAVTDSGDGRMFFLGHKELYLYEGGPNLKPICQQYTRQLFAEFDRTKVNQILLFHNENRKEIWTIYPITGGSFKVLIWNYVEDSATIDIYSNASFQPTAIGLVDWSTDPTWSQLSNSDLANEITWAQLPSSLDWDTFVSASINHAPVFGSADAGLRLHGSVYNREGAGYTALSESMDYDLGAPDNFKYVDVVVLALQLSTLVPVPAGATMYVQVGTQASLSGAAIIWTDPFPILVDGTQLLPVKVNPGGSGRYLRVRFYSQDPDVQWRIEQFEILARPGGFY